MRLGSRPKDAQELSSGRLSSGDDRGLWKGCRDFDTESDGLSSGPELERRADIIRGWWSWWSWAGPLGAFRSRDGARRRVRNMTRAKNSRRINCPDGDAVGEWMRLVGVDSRLSGSEGRG